MEFLGASNLEILYWGNGPTFCNGLTDITLWSFGLPESFELGGFLGTLRQTIDLICSLRGSVQVRLIRKPRGTTGAPSRRTC